MSENGREWAIDQMILESTHHITAAITTNSILGTALLLMMEPDPRPRTWRRVRNIRSILAPASPCEEIS